MMKKILQKLITKTISALLVVPMLWITGCPNSTGQEKKAGGNDFPFELPQTSQVPNFFYLNEKGEPSDIDIGETGIYVEGADVLGISRDSDEGEVRFVYLAEDRPFSETLLLTDWDMEGEILFPRRFITEIDGEILECFISDFNITQETFTLTEVAGDQEILSKFTLNRDVFNVYKDNPDLNLSQNRRVKMLFISTAIITVVETQWGESISAAERIDGGSYAILTKGSVSKTIKAVAAVAVAVVAIAVVVYTAPVTLTVGLAGGGVGIGLSFSATSAVTAVAAGTAYVSSIIAVNEISGIINVSKENTRPPEVEPEPINRTGQTGPNGGTLVDVRDSGFPNNIEIKPHSALMNYWTAAEEDGLPAGWRLPTPSELAMIYHLYIAQGKLALEQLVTAQLTNSFVLTDAIEEGITQSTTRSLVLDLTIKETSNEGDNFSKNFVWIGSTHQVNILLVREITDNTSSSTIWIQGKIGSSI
ncbi:MAG: hypothetical protein LBC76_03615 [Treponema sp.]|jgi:hypothetical protein|nr:hypothetical protein [Treponema sp.]